MKRSTRSTWTLGAVGVALLAVPFAVLCAVQGPPKPPNPAFVWWVAVALPLAGGAVWLLLRFLPARSRAWNPAVAVSAFLVCCYASTFPVVWLLLFYAPPLFLAWAVAMVLGLAGTAQLRHGRILGVWLSVTPAAALGVVGVTASGTPAAGTSYGTIGGWAGLDACAVLIAAAAAACLTERRQHASPAGAGAGDE